MIRIMYSDCFQRLDALTDAACDLVAGERLFRRGDEVQRLYIVTKGTLLLQRDTIDGDLLIVQRASAGCVLAEASVRSKRYHCDAQASVTSSVRSVSVSRVTDALMSDTALANAWTSMLAHELQRSRAQSEILRLKGVARRLDAWLALEGCELPPRGHQRAVADEIGVTPEALYRELARRRNSA